MSNNDINDYSDSRDISLFVTIVFKGIKSIFSKNKNFLSGWKSPLAREATKEFYQYSFRVVKRNQLGTMKQLKKSKDLDEDIYPLI